MQPVPRNFDFATVNGAVLWEVIHSLRSVTRDDFMAALPEGVTVEARNMYWGAYEIEPVRFFMDKWIQDRWWHPVLNELLRTGMSRLGLLGL